MAAQDHRLQLAFADYCRRSFRISVNAFETAAKDDDQGNLYGHYQGRPNYVDRVVLIIH